MKKEGAPGHTTELFSQLQRQSHKELELSGVNTSGVQEYNAHGGTPS